MIIFVYTFAKKIVVQFYNIHIALIIDLNFLKNLKLIWFLFSHTTALLKIPWDPQLQHYAPVCLPISSETKNETFHGINCVATGWGRTEMSGPLQDRLRHVELKVIDNQHCADMYGMKYNIKVDQDMHLCAGPILSGGKGTCIVSIS